MPQKDDNGRSLEQPQKPGRADLKTDQIAMLARQLHNMQINGQRATLSNNSMRFELAIGDSFVNASFDTELELFTITWRIPYYRSTAFGNPVSENVIHQFSSSATAGLSPRLIFDKPALDVGILLYFDTVDLFTGSVEAVKWDSGTAETSDTETEEREIIGSVYEGLNRFAQVTIKADGTFDIFIFNQLNLNILRPLFVINDFGLNQSYTYNRDNQRFSGNAKVYARGGVTSLTFTTAPIAISTSVSLFIEWSSTGIGTMVDTLSGGELISKKLATLTTAADGGVENFVLDNDNPIVFPPSVYTNPTISDGDKLNTVGGIIITKT